MSRESAAGQEGNDLKPGFFPGQSRKPEKHGENLGNDKINDDEERKQGQRKIDVHGSHPLNL